jgi:ATP-dependent Clp protease protease subunit
MSQMQSAPIPAQLLSALKARKLAACEVRRLFGVPGHVTGRVGAPRMGAKPTFDVSRPGNVEFEIPARALGLWSDSPVKAAAADDVISILDPIGFDPWSGAGVTAKRIIAALRNIGEKPVTVQINSPGGDFFEGLAIYNALAMHPKAVTVQVLGIAASAASVIAMAGDTIQISKAGFFMIHNTQWVAIGDRNAMRETADIMQQFDEVAAGLYADRTGVDAKAAGKMMDAETWMGGEAAVAKGFADALLAFEPAKDDAKAMLAYRVEAMLARAGVPRSERRRVIKELGTPSAVHDAKPGAGDDQDDGEAFVASLKSFRP